jgi:hypothetical protein
MRAESIEHIILCKNNIGKEGLFALIKANWTKISVIDLGNIIFTKVITKLETKDALILGTANGI